MIDKPPALAIAAAIDQARLSPCMKDRRGVVIWRRGLPTDTYFPRAGGGYNGLPGTGGCLRTSECQAACGKLCVHAEMRAIREALVCERTHRLADFDGLHVKLNADLQLEAGGGPSCWQCSREIVDVDLGNFWLYEVVLSPGEWSPWDDVDAYGVHARWRRYTAEWFHRATLRHPKVIAAMRGAW